MRVRVNDLMGLSYMPPVVEDADGKHYAMHHTSYKRGYHTTKRNTLKPYSGKFGKGYTVERWATNKYHYITYYIESDGD